VADKSTRTELAEAVRELRAEVAAFRAERAAHHCHGCGCRAWSYYPYPLTPQPYPVPYTVTCDTPLNLCASGLMMTTAVVNTGTGTYLVS
jgi:hypothetical protein